MEAQEGDGAAVKRLFPAGKEKHFDPFILMDNFKVTPPAGYPYHPHRGFEAITYMLDGTFQHKDNIGNDSKVGKGGAQRFTAGRGIIHSEMPGDSTTAHGIQLWINLPKKQKGIAPSYQELQASDIPELNYKGATIRTVVGKGSPLQLKTNVEYLHVSLPKRKSFVFDKTYEQTLFYLVSGKLEMKNDEELLPGQAYIFSSSDLHIKAKALEDSEVIFLSGKPLRQKIRHRGPYVD
jgi:redox-sensitive bicupin YhaK (pirin superfamily)